MIRRAKAARIAVLFLAGAAIAALCSGSSLAAFNKRQRRSGLRRADLQHDRLGRRTAEDLSSISRAKVRWFSDAEGWGVLDAPEAPGGAFVHFSHIEIEGYKTLRQNQVVEVELEGPLSFEQNGCRYRAARVRPIR